MAIFAVVTNNIIENIAEAESAEVLQLLLPGKEIIAETETTGFAWVGAEIINGKFKPPQNYASWIFDDELFVWVPPVPMPTEGKCLWNEETQSWVELSPEVVTPTREEISAE